MSRTVKRVYVRKDGQPLWITLSYRSEVAEWGLERMLHLVKLNDNGAPFFLVKTKRSVRDLERLFRQRNVALMLEESVGGIVGGLGLTSPGTLYMQIDKQSAGDDELLDLCLSEIGVEIIAPQNPPMTMFERRGGSE